MNLSTAALTAERSGEISSAGLLPPSLRAPRLPAFYIQKGRIDFQGHGPACNTKHIQKGKNTRNATFTLSWSLDVSNQSTSQEKEPGTRLKTRICQQSPTGVGEHLCGGGPWNRATAEQSQQKHIKLYFQCNSIWQMKHHFFWGGCHS